MKKEILSLMVICLVLTFSAASARAEAVSTSQARMDWTSLTITGNITWGEIGSQSYAYAEDDTGSNEDIQPEESGWVDTSASASVYHASGNADTNNNYLYEEVYAIANDTTTMWAYADAEAWRWGYFTANSNGWVTFSADYELSQDLETGYVDEWAYGYAEAGLWLTNYETSVQDYNLPVLENEVWDGDSITDSDAGKLTVAVRFDAGDEGYFEAWVYNEADVEVPEPATICLLGLGALSLLRRKR